jgi:TonB family protein
VAITWRSRAPVPATSAVRECPIARTSEIKDKGCLGAVCKSSMPRTAVVKSMESQATSVATAESQSGTPSTTRLVIRVKIVPGGPPPPPAWWRRRTSALLLIAGAVAIVLSWVGISMFKNDSTSEPVPVPTAAAPAVRDEPLPQPATETVEAKSAEVEPAVREQPDAPPSPINEVIPDVPRSARETIRGTIRVSVRVTLDAQGTVLAATAVERGPSRYFERLATEAARKWTFTPAASEPQRSMLVTFSFTRGGTTARAKQP